MLLLVSGGTNILADFLNRAKEGKKKKKKEYIDNLELHLTWQEQAWRPFWL